MFTFPARYDVLRTQPRSFMENGPTSGEGGKAHGWKPIPVLIEELNRHLRGWAGYFRFGYPRRALDQINRHVLLRLGRHLRRRSQRPFQSPKGVTAYEHYKRLGLQDL